MKRVLQYKATEHGYGCFEDEEPIFEIRTSDLQFDVKKFYQAFYGEGKEYDDIVIENHLANDRKAMRVYECIKKIVEEVRERFVELSQQSGVPENHETSS